MPCRDRHVLAAINLEANRICDDLTACLKVPQRFPCHRVECVEVPFIRPAKNDSAAGSHHSRPGRRLNRELPPQLPCPTLERANRSTRLIACESTHSSSGEKDPRLILRFALVIVCTHLTHCHIEQFVHWIVRRTEPVSG